MCVWGGGGGGGGDDDHPCMTSSMYLFEDCGVGMMNISLVPRPSSRVGVLKSRPCERKAWERG